MYKLLIVDDESEIRNGLSQYFPWREVGFEIAGLAENAEQALQLLGSVNIDAMLCDIRMPGMLGIDLAETVSRQYPHVNIILLSGYKEFDYAQRAMACGVKRYLIKPTRYPDLYDAFQKLKDELSHHKKQVIPGMPRHIGASLPGSIEPGEHYVIESVRAYVQQHFDHVTLDQVARHVHMSPNYISKLFKQKTGTNFIDYVIAVKMHKAAELLKRVDYKTYEISEAVGYSNPRNFTRAFKSFFGVGPKAYRENSHLHSNIQKG